MNYFEKQQNRAFQPIQEDPIILDFSGCKYLGEIHLVLKEKFGLPEYYGENWDALWDCLDGRFDESESITVEIHGYAGLSRTLRDCCAPMMEIFGDVQQQTPNVVFKFIS